MKYIEEQICYKIVRDTSVGLDERLDIINRAVAQGSAGQCISLSGTYMQTHCKPTFYGEQTILFSSVFTYG